MRQFSKFFRLSAAERRLVLEAAFLMGAARMVVIIMPFRWVASVLESNPNGEKIEQMSEQIKRVAWAVRRTSHYTPWRSNCLAKAIAGKYMLRRRRISNTLYMGVIKNSQGEFEAHAWLRSGETIITGGSHLERYAIVAVFAE
jgi:hypothetical protein